jgi:glycosyltransferase involved in cell wall biosynthesis
MGRVRGFCQRREGRLLISKSVVLVVPGRLDTLTGGYGYDRRIVAGLAVRGWTVAVRELHDSFPFPTPEARAEARSVLASIGDGAVVLVDGLAFGVLPDEAERETGRLRLVALVHHPLAAEAGLSIADANVLEAAERRALAAVKRVVVTSRRTAAALAHYGVGQDRISVVEPGTDRAPLAHGSTGGPLHLVCVASLVPRKGHDVLFRALAAIPFRGWRLTCVGSVDRPGAMADQLRTLARALDLEDHIAFVGEADGSRLQAYYASADVFVLPTLYEGYGMVVAEALAHGLPIISTRTGAIAELVGEQAGILVSPGDVKALAKALAQVLDDNDANGVPVRERLARGARQVRDTLPTWDEAVRRMDDVLSGVSG